MQSLRDLITLTMRGDRRGKKPVFAPYENKVSAGTDLDALIKRGMAIVRRRSFCKVEYPNVKITSEIHKEGNYEVKRDYVTTPKGTITQVSKTNNLTSYVSEHFIKSEQDYDAYKFYVDDAVIVPYYDNCLEALKEDSYWFVRSQLPREPMQQLIISAMGTEQFCFDWMDYRDRVLDLYESLVNFNRKQFKVAGECPLEFINCGANVTTSVVSKQMFQDYYLPYYAETAEALHPKGKSIGCHFDADNTLIMDDIGKSKLDYIEAYDISCSPPLKDAIKAAPDKVFWVNFPSAAHLYPDKKIYETAIMLLEEGKDAKGLVMGITEDVPREHWVRSYNIIMDAIDDFYK